MEIICTQCKVKKDMTYRKRQSISIEMPFCSKKCSRLWQSINLTKQVADPNELKKCSCCKEFKERKEFNIKSKSGNVHSYCKKCLYIYQMKRWNGKKIRAVEYKGGKCVKCGLVDHPVVYDFHHLNDDKDADWNSLRNKKWKTITDELDKCVLLCSPCHRKEHLNIKIWPEWKRLDPP